MPLRNPVDQPGSWQTPTLLSGWSNYGSGYAPVAYRKDLEGIVWLRGVITNASTPSAGSNIFVLPTGYRPANNHVFCALSGGPDTLGRVDVYSDGSVVYFSGSNLYFCFSNVAFLVGS